MKVFLKFLVIVALAMPLSGVAQTKNKLDESGNKHGEWVGSYENGRKHWEGQFDHGKPIGTFTYYTPGGVLESLLTFGPDGTTAKVKIFYDDGKKLMAEGNYINQKRDSVWTFHSFYDYVSSRETYVEGVKQGAATVYYENGKVARKVDFVNGVEQGPTIEYFESGQKKMEGTYVDGRLEGRVTRYHPNGFVYSIGSYVDGRRHGNFIFYDEMGREAARKRYYRGQDATKPEPKPDNEAGE